MKTLYFSSGISGSGKDFYLYNRFLLDFPEVKEVLDKHQIEFKDLIVCPDDLRRELLGSVNEQSKGDYIFAEAKRRINDKLDEYGIAIFNATTLSKNRLKFINNIHSNNKVMLVLKPDVNLSWERIKEQINNGEDRSAVPFDVINRQYYNFKLQIIGDENWDEIWNDVVKEKIIDRFDKYKVFFIN
jgi:predicted kinase